MIKLLQKRFNELLEQADAVAASKRLIRVPHSEDREDIDSAVLLEWTVKVRNLLESGCGQSSAHFQIFIEEDKKRYSSASSRFKRLLAVFKAAKEDFEGGYLISVRNLVQAEVFSNEIEQARELLESKFTLAAAVVCGVVLETNLRSMCEANGLELGSLDRMNAELTKAGRYNSLVQKRITALAAIRNSAAHGKGHEFTADDVRAMIDDVERYLTDWLC